MTQWPGIVTDSTPIDSRPGIAVYQQNTRTRVVGELRRRRGMARSSLDKFTAAATGQASTNNTIGPFSMFQVGSTLEGVASGYALWGDAQLLRPTGFATLSAGVYTININRQGDTAAQAYVIIAKSGNYPAAYEDGILATTAATVPGSNTLSTTWTPPGTGTWYFAAYGVATGVRSPLGNIPVTVPPVVTVNTLATPPGSSIEFGESIATYNGIILIGDSAYSGVAVDAGRVYVYDSSYTLLDTLTALNFAENFGLAIAWANAGFFFASSPQQTHSGDSMTGAMSAYTWDGADAVKVEEMFAFSTSYPNRLLGYGLACSPSGSVVYAGALSLGAAGRLFIMRGTPTSHDDGTAFYPSRSSTADEFGRHVAISANGAVLAVTAPDGLALSGNDTGLCFVYDIALDGLPINETILAPTGADDAAGGSFGLRTHSLSNDGSKLAVGGNGFCYYYERLAGVWTRVLRVATNATCAARVTPDGAFLIVGDSPNTYVYSTATLALVSTIVMPGNRGLSTNGASIIANQQLVGTVRYTS